MSNETTIVAKRQSDGALVQVMPDGTTRPLRDTADWDQLRAMTDEDVLAAAIADPDARPVCAEELVRAPRVPQAKTVRRAWRLTQEEFAARYHIPRGTLWDWDQEKSEPDQSARVDLRAIAGDADGVFRAWQAVPKSKSI
jgi:putative transcriptional regulator